MKLHTSARAGGRTACALLAAALLAAACSSSGSTGSTRSGSAGNTKFAVSVVSDLTGPAAAPVGIPGANGIQLAFKQANAAGGIDGHQIDVRLIDTHSTANDGATAAQQAVSGNPSAIAFTGTAIGLDAGVPTYRQAALPLVSLTANEALVNPVTRWFFTMAPTAEQYALTMVGQAKALSGGKLTGLKIAEEYVDDPAAASLSHQAVKLAKSLGATITGSYANARQATSFASQAQSIVSSGTNIVFLTDSASGAVTVVKALITAGYKGVIFGPNGAFDPATFKAVGSKQFEVFTTFYNVAPGSRIAGLASKFGITPGNSFFSVGYAEGLFILDVLKKCGYPCGGDRFISTAESAGTVTLPTDVAFAPLAVSTQRHSLVTGVGWFGWDSTTQQVALLNKLTIP